MGHQGAPLHGETPPLLHPPLHLVGVSIGMERGCQLNDSLADGCIQGKALGVPLWQLLGGKMRDRVTTRAAVLLNRPPTRPSRCSRERGGRGSAESRVAVWVGQVHVYAHAASVESAQALIDKGHDSHWHDCHSADAPSPTLLTHLLKGEGGAAE